MRFLFKHLSIRYKLFLPFLLVTIILIILMTIFAREYQKNHLNEEINDHVKLVVSSLGTSFETHSTKPQQRRLLKSISLNEIFNSIYIIDSKHIIYLGDNARQEGQAINSVDQSFSQLLNRDKISSKNYLFVEKNDNQQLVVASIYLNLQKTGQANYEKCFILINLDTTDIQKRNYELFVFILKMLIVFSVLLFLIVQFVVSIYIIKPILILNRFISNHKLNIHQGNDSVLDHINNDEVGKLGRALVLQIEKLDFQTLNILDKNKKLLNINEEIQQASSIKQNFLAKMSHEIRTPINGIVCINELLYETNLDKTQLNYVKMIDSSGRMLLGIVNDILDFSMIEAKKLVLENRKLNFHSLILENLDFFKPLFIKKQLDLKLNFEVSTDQWVYTDSLRIKQVLNNLFSNSLKFTHQGNVELTVRKNNLNNIGNYLLIVKDSGIGMSPLQQALLFKPFEQSDPSITRKYGGTGLGLVITKSLIEAMGGTIWLESTKNVGTTFFFTLEITDIEKQQDQPDKMVGHYVLIYDQFKVLIVDDNSINRIITNGFLRKRFSDISEAEDGQVAFDFYVLNRPNFIFMDLQMPNVDGYTSTKMIRDYEIEHSFKPAIIIALTANAQLEEKARTLKSGFNFYLTKPIKQQELYSLVDILIAMKNS